MTAQVMTKKKAGYSSGTASDKVKRYLPLVKHIAGKLSRNLPPVVEYADLVAVGLVGLLDAMSRFDSSRGIKFETYATHRVRGEILNRLNSLSWIPRRVREKAHGLERASIKLQDRLGRVPDEEELARELGLSQREFRKLLSDTGPVSFMSIDEMMTMEEHPGAVPMSLRDENPADEVERRLMREEVVEGLKGLPERERLIVTLYFYEDLTLKEIGQILDISESRSCQLLSQAMGRLRGYMEAKSGG